MRRGEQASRVCSRAAPPYVREGRVVGRAVYTGSKALERRLSAGERERERERAPFFVRPPDCSHVRDSFLQVTQCSGDLCVRARV